MRFLLSAAMLAAFAANAAAQTAGGQFVDRDGSEIGSVTIETTASGMLLVKAQATGIPAGSHGFHIHETGACDPASGFESAGGHLAGGNQHGVMYEGGPHPGDFPNVHTGKDGILRVEFFTDRLALAGEGSILEGDGAAVVVHASADDYSSQPSGKAGDRIACAILSAQ